ncbi:hypothetical protein Tco_1545388 [Tanacetum coccineum]
MEAHLAPKQPIQVNKITSLCGICSGPHNTQYCIENPEQAFVENASSRTDEVGVHQSDPHNDKQEEDEQKGEGNPKNTNATERREEQWDTPQPVLKKPTAIDNIGSSRNDEEIEWFSVEEPLDLVDTKITFKTLYKDPERSKLSSEGHDLFSSRIILNEDDYDRGCRKPSDLEDRFYRDTIKLGPEYLTGVADDDEVT